MYYINRSLLLFSFFATLTFSFPLLGQMFPFGIVPMPFLLDVLRSKIHVDLLLKLLFFKGFLFIIFNSSLVSEVFLFVTVAFDYVNLDQTVFIILLDFFFDIFEYLNFLFSWSVFSIRYLSYGYSSFLNEATDTFRHKSLNFNLCLEFINFILLFSLKHFIKSLDTW